MDRRDFKEPAHLRAHAGAGAGRNNCNYGLWKSHGKQNNCSHPHFPFLNKHGSFFAKLYQHRSYVIALEKRPECRRHVCGRGPDGHVLSQLQEFAAGRRRRPPHRKTGRGLAGTAGFRPAALSQGRRDIPLGYPGLHVSGRRSLYRPLFRQRIRPVCGHRFNSGE